MKNVFDFSPGVSTEVKYILLVHDVEPKYGSQEGGTLLTLSGEGFSVNCTENDVTVGGARCTVKACMNNEIVCETSSHSEVHKVDNSGNHPRTIEF